MALHTQLPIYKAAYELLDVAVEITRNIPRDFKRLIAEKVREECLEIMVLIFRQRLETLIAEGAEFPCFFASTEY